MTTEYECSQCGEVFDKMGDFRRHCASYHSDRPMVYNIIRNGYYAGPRFLKEEKE